MLEEKEREENPLCQVRDRLDEIDCSIVKLLHQRMQYVQEVVSIKLENELPLYDGEREERMLANYNRLLGPVPWQTEIAYMMKQVIAGSRAYQARLMGKQLETTWDWQEEEKVPNRYQGARFAFQGVEGSFGHQALQQFLQMQGLSLTSESVRSYPTFKTLCDAVVQGEVEYGMLPVENSYAGSVQEVYELLSQSPLYIQAEYILPISHHLLVNPGTQWEQIERVLSHPQALQQCDDFLSQYPQWERIPTSNTAASASEVAVRQDRRLAAIASKEAAHTYGLDILASQIESGRGNRTRFVLLGRKKAWSPRADKLTLCFSLPHRAGALAEVLSTFLLYQINMVEIHSQPAKTTPWQYKFFVDIEGSLKQPNLIAALQLLQSMTHSLKLIGHYVAAEEPSIYGR